MIAVRVGEAWRCACVWTTKAITEANTAVMTTARAPVLREYEGKRNLPHPQAPGQERVWRTPAQPPPAALLPGLQDPPAPQTVRWPIRARPKPPRTRAPADYRQNQYVHRLPRAGRDPPQPIPHQPASRHGPIP